MKKHLKYKTALSLLMTLIISGSSIAQSSVQIERAVNVGTNSWGVGSFDVKGTYSTTLNSKDLFYNIGGVPLYIKGDGAAPQFSNLILDNGADVFIESENGITVDATLQSMGGIIHTVESPYGAIHMGMTSTFNGSNPFNETHFIDGFMISDNTSFTYPLGNGGIYSPIYFEFPLFSTLRYKATDPGNSTSISTMQGANNLATVSTKEHYLYSGFTATGFKVTIPYNNFGTDGYVGDISKLTIAGWNGMEWENLGDGTNIIDATAETVTVTLSQDLNFIQKLALASTDPINLLAVNLQSFTAINDGNCGVRFSWKLSSDEMLKSFELQESTTGADFSSFKTIIPAAASSYSYVKQQATAGHTYYRLKITSKSGGITYSDVVKYRNACKAITILVSPNPVKDLLYVSGMEAGNQLSLVNAAGATLTTQKSNGATATLNMRSYSNGIYFVIVSSAEGIILEKKQIVKK